MMLVPVLPVLIVGLRLGLAKEDEDVVGVKIPLTSGVTGTGTDAETQRRPLQVDVAEDGDEEESVVVIKEDVEDMDDGDEGPVGESVDMLPIVLLETVGEGARGLSTPLRSDEARIEAELETDAQSSPEQDIDAVEPKLELELEFEFMPRLVAARLAVVTEDVVRGLSIPLTREDRGTIAEADAETQSSPWQTVDAVDVILVLESEVELDGFVTPVGEDVNGSRTPLTVEETGRVAETDTETQSSPEQDSDAEEDESSLVVVVGGELNGFKAPFIGEESGRFGLPETETQGSPVQDEVVVAVNIGIPTPVIEPIPGVFELCVPDSEDLGEEVGGIPGSEAESVTQIKLLHEVESPLAVGVKDEERG